MPTRILGQLERLLHWAKKLYRNSLAGPQLFGSLQWQADCVRLDDLLFRLEHTRDDSRWQGGGKYFNLYKVKELYDDYERLFAGHRHFQAQNVLEIGVWDGGSLVIWNEVFRPAKLVGVDFRSDRGDSAYFSEYLERRNLRGTVKTYWGVNQADSTSLLDICRQEFRAPLDLVIDDASHFYEETRASFETLFPLMRPGGLYIIEDWAWPHWPEFDHHPYFAGKRALTDLVFEIVELIGSRKSQSPASLRVMPGFVAIQKAAGPIEQPFHFGKHIARRPNPRDRDNLPDLVELNKTDWNRAFGDTVLQNLKASLQDPVVDGKRFPLFPDEQLQVSVNGTSGDTALMEAYPFYQKIVDYAYRLGIDISSSTRVLDFGCGWGRHLRFFWQLVDPENLYGVDLDPEFVALCRRLFPSGCFLQGQLEPPTPVADASMDIVWSYSVFSHLNHKYHLKWMRDIHRILRPGGMFIATTQGRSFIDYCWAQRAQEPLEKEWQRLLAEIFPTSESVDAAHGRFDAGEFQYFHIGGGGGPRDDSFYGEAVVPEKFIRDHWSPYFRIVSYYDPRCDSQQVVVVAVKL